MKNVLVIFTFVLSLEMWSQAPRRFYTRIGGDGDEVAYSAKQTLDGQYIIAGSGSSYGSHGNTDVYIVRLDSMGFPMWERYFGGFGNEAAKSVIQLPDSGYVIAGFTNSFGAGGYDAYLLKIDKVGNLLWQRTFGGLDWDFANDLVLGSDGNIFVVGNTFSFGNGKKDGFVLKYDMTGNLLFQKFIGGAENEDLNAIIRTNDNFLATVGYTESKNDIDGDGYFAKLDLNGDTLFTKTFGGPHKDYFCDIGQKGISESYAYILSGAKTYTAGGKTHSYMYTMSPGGAYIADSSDFRNGVDESFVSLAISKWDNYLTGFVRSTLFAVNKMQADLYISYQNGLYFLGNSSGGTGNEYAYSIEATRDGGFVTVGSTTSYGSVGTDIYFLKQDTTFVNYSSVVGVRENSKAVVPFVKYLENSIVIRLQESSAESIKIYDLNGRLFKQIASAEKDMIIDTSTFPASLYILTIELTTGEIYRHKFICR